MSKPTFEDFIELCKLNTENIYVPELLNITKYSDCIYSSGVIMPYEYILDVYTIRLEIAEENKKLLENEILDFKSCVNNISKFKTENIGVLNLAAENNYYMLFYEPKENRIIGIIKFLKTQSLKNVENYNDEIIQKGFSSKAQKYSKGELIKEWK